MSDIRVASRQSPLALWQTEAVIKHLRLLDPELDIEIIPISTKGDEIQDRPLREVGGKALFVKGLEEALLAGQADIAVHSMKDVPAALETCFTISAMLARENPLDAFVSERYARFDDLPEGAVVGTCSLRRQAQILALRPDLKIKNLRGNIQRRLRAVKTDHYDATLLASAGLRRMGQAEHIKHEFSLAQCLPASGQGAIGIEVLADNHHLIDLTQQLNHFNSMLCVNAERSMCRSLNGSCHSPIGAFAQVVDGVIELRGIVAKIDGTVLLTASAMGDDPEIVGSDAAEILLEQGAADYL